MYKKGENLHSHTTPSLEVRIQRKTSLSLVSLEVMEFKGPTGRFFCIDLLHDVKLPLKHEKSACRDHFLPIHQLTKSFIKFPISIEIWVDILTKKNSEKSKIEYAFQCNMNREDF